jgi:hypothetical protein
MRAAFRAALLRPTRPLVRLAFAAAWRKFWRPRARAMLRAWRESDDLDAADRPSRLRAPRTARDRLAEGLRLLGLVVFPLGLGGSFTPALLAFDRPMAIACLVLRAPCLPSRTWCISSRTNPPACVLGAFPERASRRARLMVSFLGIKSSRLVPASARDWPGHQSGLKFMSNGSQHAVAKSGIGVNKYARFVSLD